MELTGRKIEEDQRRESLDEVRDHAEDRRDGGGEITVVTPRKSLERGRGALLPITLQDHIVIPLVVVP